MIVLWDVRSGVGRPTLVFVEFVETADVGDEMFGTTTGWVWVVGQLNSLNMFNTRGVNQF